MNGYAIGLMQCAGLLVCASTTIGYAQPGSSLLWGASTVFWCTVIAAIVVAAHWLVHAERERDKRK